MSGVESLVSLNGLVQLGQFCLEPDQPHFGLQSPLVRLVRRLEGHQVRDQFLRAVLVQVNNKHCKQDRTGYVREHSTRQNFYCVDFLTVGRGWFLIAQITNVCGKTEI